MIWNEKKKKQNRYEIIRTPSIIDDNFVRIAKHKFYCRRARARALNFACELRVFIWCHCIETKISTGRFDVWHSSDERKKQQNELTSPVSRPDSHCSLWVPFVQTARVKWWHKKKEIIKGEKEHYRRSPFWWWWGSPTQARVWGVFGVGIKRFFDRFFFTSNFLS